MILGVLEYIYYLAQYSIGDSGFGREPNFPINLIFEWNLTRLKNTRIQTSIDEKKKHSSDNMA